LTDFNGFIGGGSKGGRVEDKKTTIWNPDQWYEIRGSGTYWYVPVCTGMYWYTIVYMVDTGMY